MPCQPIVAFAGRLILLEVSRFDARGEQRIALQTERLATVGLGACSRSTRAAPQTGDYVTARAMYLAASQNII
jgi:hypothetical protein